MTWTVRMALEQAHVIYMMGMAAAKESGDAQAANFWASHAETVRCVLDEIELCEACERKATR